MVVAPLTLFIYWLLKQIVAQFFQNNYYCYFSQFFQVTPLEVEFMPCCSYCLISSNVLLLFHFSNVLLFHFFYQLLLFFILQSSLLFFHFHQSSHFCFHFVLVLLFQKRMVNYPICIFCFP